MSNKSKVKIQAERVEKEYLKNSLRLCTCGSGEEAYLCNGLPEEGWTYCG